MTDERMGDSLWTALERLPRGSGVVFRHYGVPLAERRALFVCLIKVARRRGLVVVRAGGDRLGRGAAGVHGRRGPGLRTFPAHSRREAVAAMRAGADAVFVSPVFPTRSHPGARALGRVGLGLAIRGLRVPVIALGGMDARRAASVQPLGVHGWRRSMRGRLLLPQKRKPRDPKHVARDSGLVILGSCLHRSTERWIGSSVCRETPGERHWRQKRKAVPT